MARFVELPEYKEARAVNVDHITHVVHDMGGLRIELVNGKNLTYNADHDEHLPCSHENLAKVYDAIIKRKNKEKKK